MGCPSTPQYVSQKFEVHRGLLIGYPFGFFYNPFSFADLPHCLKEDDIYRGMLIPKGSWVNAFG